MSNQRFDVAHVPRLKCLCSSIVMSFKLAIITALMPYTGSVGGGLVIVVETVGGP